MGETILKVSNIKKTIKQKEIIKGISFEIKEGEIVGFLGPNGAGKSTSLRMIVGLSKPSSGHITICGYSITDSYVKAMTNVGCIIEAPDLYNYMSGYKNLEMLASMSKGVSKKDIDDAVELVGMENRIHDKVAIYSMGMKQRVGLAQALIHKPKLLVLDEPTNGLDPQGIHEFRDIVKNLAKEKGISVLISSHIISEVQLMCDRVSIINNGEIIKNASIEELVSTGEVYWVLNDLQKGKEILEKNFQIDSRIENDGLVAFVEVEMLSKINKELMDAGINLQYVSTKKRTLEDLFLSLTSKQKIQ
jgi:ABC-2 type transport system ATP-binding protein